MTGAKTQPTATSRNDTMSLDGILRCQETKEGVSAKAMLKTNLMFKELLNLSTSSFEGENRCYIHVLTVTCTDFVLQKKQLSKHTLQRNIAYRDAVKKGEYTSSKRKIPNHKDMRSTFHDLKSSSMGFLDAYSSN